MLKDLFAGQQWRADIETPYYGHGERQGEGEMYAVSNMETYITKCKIDSQQEFAISMAQETQTGALYQPRGVGWGGRWEGGSKGTGYMYTYG